ncbi:MAG: hypothetical protein E7Z86_04930 [Methanosphaera stadtmanae]|nr:hypothetical protein [Methanosphaera stadtmanae]
MNDRSRRSCKKRKMLKINENNDIESIIEIFQQFEKKYDIITTKLDENIQYQVNDMKITQTYTSTIRKANMNKMTQLLKQQGHITLIIINNTKKQEQNETEKIKQLKKLKNVNIKLIKENQIIKTLEKVIDEG